MDATFLLGFGLGMIVGSLWASFYLLRKRR